MSLSWSFCCQAITLYQFEHGALVSHTSNEMKMVAASRYNSKYYLIVQKHRPQTWLAVLHCNPRSPLYCNNLKWNPEWIPFYNVMRNAAVEFTQSKPLKTLQQTPKARHDHEHRAKQSLFSHCTTILMGYMNRGVALGVGFFSVEIWLVWDNPIGCFVAFARNVSI